MCTQTQISYFTLKTCLISFSLDNHTLFCERTGTLIINEQLPLSNCQFVLIHQKIVLQSEEQEAVINISSFHLQKLKVV